MKHKKIKLSVILLLGLGLTGLYAQETIPATGGNTSGSGGSVSYSVGQIAYKTYIGVNASIAEGVQQPFEISVVTGIKEDKGINLSVSAYPNPTIDYLTLEVDVLTMFNNQKILYQLYDMNGKLLQNKRITDKQTSIIMSNLLPATYFVKVIQGNKEVKTFKIIIN